MIKCIKIRKYKKENEQHYYKVSTEDFKSKPYYVAIDEKTHLISIYKTEYDEKPLVEVDLEFSKDWSNIDIDRKIIFPALVQISKAIKKNLFPDFLDYCA